MTIITATVEPSTSLTAHEATILGYVASAINDMPFLNIDTLDKVEALIRVGLNNPVNGLGNPNDWQVYRGGSHVALLKLARRVGDTTSRVLFVTERRPEPTPEERVIRYTEALAASLQACTGAVSVTVSDGDQTATVAAPEGLGTTKAHPDDFPTVAPVAQPGDIWDVYANQGLREGWVLAVIGNDVLVEYTMPKGTTALRIVKTSGLEGFQNVSYRNVPRKWLEAIVAAGSVWEGKAQGVYQPASRWGKSNNRRVASAADMLLSRDASRVK